MTDVPIRRIGRMPRWQCLPSHIILAVCAFSGLLYFVRHELHIELPVMTARHFLVTHGVSSAFALLMFGAVLPVHLRSAWIAKRNRLSGTLMLALMSVLMLSGLMLYYGSEEVRDSVVLTHWIAGFIAFAVFALHLSLGRRSLPASTIH